MPEPSPQPASLSAALRVALCDDEPAAIEANAACVARCSRACGVPVEVATYTQGGQLLYDVEDDAAHFDLFLLDIEMPGVDGMELAARLRRRLPDAKAIFVTSHDEYAIDAFELSIFRYVPKGEPGPRLVHAVTDALKLLAVGLDRAYTVRRGGSLERIAYRDIAYIDRAGKDSAIHCDGGRTVRVRKSLQRVFDELGSDEFAFIDRGVVVNLAKVARVKGPSAVLVSGEELPVSRSHARGLRERLADFWGSRI